MASPTPQPLGSVVAFSCRGARLAGAARARDWRTIHPTSLARWLSTRVTKTTYGTGLRSPYAMQYAIELTGIPRILIAAAIHPIGRLLGQRGWFYLVAGLNARMMDAEHTMGVKAFYECCIPAPADPPGSVRERNAAPVNNSPISDNNEVRPAGGFSPTSPRERMRLL